MQQQANLTINDRSLECADIVCVLSHAIKLFSVQLSADVAEVCIF